MRKHAKLLERPVELVCRMLAAVPQLGDSAVAVDAVHTVEAIFGDLAGHGGRLSVERACEVAWNTAMARFWFPDAIEQQLEFQRRGGDGDVRRILAAVADLGVLTVADGVIALTPLGSWAVGSWLGLGTPTSDVLSVKVTLHESADPEIWRRLRVPADIRLDRKHDIVLEAVQHGDHDGPRCTDGAGRCPPEDVGGIPGYEDLRRMLADAEEDGHAEALQWLGLEHACARRPVGDTWRPVGVRGAIRNSPRQSAESFGCWRTSVASSWNYGALF